MITAVDSNVLADVLVANQQFGQASADALRHCMRQGAIIASDVVWAEVATLFAPATRAEAVLVDLGLEFSAMTLDSAIMAATYWRDYRHSGGKRNRIMPDFMIAAHASLQADQLLTRDRGFYRQYFSDLTVVSPAALA